MMINNQSKPNDSMLALIFLHSLISTRVESFRALKLSSLEP
jgi:hypothetical protein